MDSYVHAPLDRKINREFMHARQKREQPHDHAKGRADKNKSSCTCSWCTKPKRQAPGLQGMRMDDFDPDMPFSNDLTEDAWDDFYRSLDADVPVTPPHLAEVSLLDLVQPSRRRPSKLSFTVLSWVRHGFLTDATNHLQSTHSK
jgi:hypothetical protein